MKRSRPWLAAIALCLMACRASQDELAELRAQQARMLERVANLEAEQRRLRPEQPRAMDRASQPLQEIKPGVSPVLGNPHARVTIVEFADFECGYCAASAPLLKQVLQRYDEDVRLIYKHFPLSFHPRARAAAVASLAAKEQNAFWEMHDQLFEHSGRLEDVSFERLAEQAGLDVERFLRDYERKQEAYERLISADYAEGLRVDVRGTPTLFVNGRKVGVRTFEEISTMIDEELERASAS